METPRFFISYRSSMTNPVSRVCHCLVRMSNISYYFHHEKKKAGPFPPQLRKELEICDTFVLFLSEDSKEGTWQTQEVTDWLGFHGNNKSRLVVVEIEKEGIPPLLPTLKDVQNVFFDLENFDGHVNCAENILEL